MGAPYRFPSLQTLLAACCAGAVLLGVLLLAQVTLSLLEADLRSNAEAEQAALAEATAGDIDEKIELHRHIITAAAKALPAHMLGDAAGLQAHFDARPVLYRFFDMLVVIDADGTVLFRAPSGGGLVGRSLADRAHVQQVLATGQTVVSEPVAGRSTHQPTIVFAAPVRDAAGQVRGVLTGGLLLTRENFLGSLATRRIGSQGYFYLATKGSHPVLAVHPQRERIMEPVPDATRNPHLRRALDGFEGTVEGMNSQGLQALYTYRSLKSVPWVLAAVYPSAEAYAPLARRRQQITSAAFVIAALAGAVVVLLCSVLMRPLRELRRRMVEATHGDGAGLVTVPGGARDIADIVVAYNALIRHKAEAEHSLNARERQLRTIADNLPVLIAYIDRDRVFRFANATYAAWFERPVAEIVDRPVQALVGASVSAMREPLFQRALAGERVPFAHELALPGGVRHIEGMYVPDRGEDGQVRGVHVLTTDVSEAKANERRLIELARHDDLTGLPNRRHFESDIQDAIARARRSGRPLALMLLDVDHFKQINDSRGHAAGDEVLKAFAQRLRGSVRITDLVARLAGDEFTILLEGIGWPEEASLVAQKILDTIAAPLLLADGAIALSTSIGVAVFHGEDITPAQLLHAADELLYAAKRAGRGTFRLAAG